MNSKFSNLNFVKSKTDGKIYVKSKNVDVEPAQWSSSPSATSYTNIDFDYVNFSDVLKNNYVKILKSYQDFVKEIKNTISTTRDSVSNLYLEDGRFLFVYSESIYTKRPSEELAFIYEPEYDELIDTIVDLFGVYDGGIPFQFSSTQYNNYRYALNYEVLELFLRDTYLKVNNIPKLKKFKIKQKSGKIREIMAPEDGLKKILRRINLTLQNVYDKRNINFQVAYKKGKSIKSNTEIHRDNKFVFVTDLSNFFPSCKRELVRKYVKFLFRNLPGDRNASAIESFLDIILEDDGLFIGSPISGTIANAIISMPCLYLKNICDKYDIKFSVYADDMTFSSEKFLNKDFVLSVFNSAFRAYNLDKYFKLNEKKLKGFSGSRRKVTGLIINESNKISVPRRYYRDLRVKIHKLSLGENVNVNKLRGKIAFPTGVDDSKKIYNLLMKFKDTVDKYKLCSDETLKKMKERIDNNA